MVAARQPRQDATTATIRNLKEKDLDIVLIGTPDHGTPLTMIAGGGIRWMSMRKPTQCGYRPEGGDGRRGPRARRRRGARSGRKGEARRTSLEARDTIVKTGNSGRSGWSKCIAIITCASGNPPDCAHGKDRSRDVDRAGADAAIQQKHHASVRLAGVHGYHGT